MNKKKDFIINNKFIKNKKKIISTFFFIFSFSLPIILLSNSNASNNNFINLTYQQTNNNLKTSNRSASEIKVLNPQSYANDTSPEGIQKFKTIKRIYSRKPSTLQNTELSSIIELGNNVVSTGNDAPKYFNLSVQPTSNGTQLPSTEPLTYFDFSTTSNPIPNIFTPDYLDANGLLAFYVEYKITGNSTTYRDYILVSGFNSEIIATTLPGEIYQNPVNELTSSQLTSFVTFSLESNGNGYVKPDEITLVPNTRVQSPQDGTISFKLDLNYQIKNNPKLNISKISNNNTIQNSEQTIATNFQKEFSYFGFQPSGNLTTTQLLIIIAIITAVVITVVILITTLTLIIKKIKFRKSF